MKRTVGEVISKLQRPDVFKPLILVTVLMLLQQCTGTATLTYYAVILMGDGNILDKYSATIIYGFIRLVSTLCGGLLLRRFARRPLLILSSLSVALGMSLLGASCYMSQDKGDKEISVLLDLLPLISVNLVAVSYQLGLGPIGWAYMAELYPVDMRAVLSGFSSMNVNFFIFLVVKTYPTLTASSLQPWGTYWLYAGVAICAALFGITLLPETKGKTLAEVSQYFYVWCTFKSKSMDNIEYQSLGNAKTTDVILSNSFVYRNTEKAMGTIKDNKEKEIEKIQLRYQRRSAELKDVEGSLKRRTLELSQLEEMINQKTEELKEQEERLKRKSAPIVMLEDLDDLLLEV